MAVAAHSTTQGADTHTPVWGLRPLLNSAVCLKEEAGLGAGAGLALTAGVACYFNKLQVESGSKGGKEGSRGSQWEEADLNTELIQAEIGKSKKKKQKKAKQNRKREA